jgi:hypothetical protein
VCIDRAHGHAICEEIGDRLRHLLGREAHNELPPRLLYLMEQLVKADLELAPSIVPSVEDMAGQHTQGERLE